MYEPRAQMDALLAEIRTARLDSLACLTQMSELEFPLPIRTMPQCMLTEADLSYGKLLAATVGLEDADLDASPRPGQWSIRAVMEHILASERKYLQAIQEAYATRNYDQAI